MMAVSVPSFGGAPRDSAAGLAITCAAAALALFGAPRVHAETAPVDIAEQAPVRLWIERGEAASVTAPARRGAGFRERSGAWPSGPAPGVAQVAAIVISKGGDGLGAPLDWRAAALANARAKSATGQSFRGFSAGLPVAASKITSNYGMRRHPLRGGWRMHSGIDLAASLGSPIYAPSDGVVAHASWRGGYGLLVELVHPNGVRTRFGHLSRIAVMAGQVVKMNQLLGLVGSTGNATGPHLHYEMRVNGLPVDPMMSHMK